MPEVILLTPEEIQNLLDTQLCGTLAVVDGNKPYQAPVTFSADDDNIYLESVPSNRSNDFKGFQAQRKGI